MDFFEDGGWKAEGDVDGVFGVCVDWDSRRSFLGRTSLEHSCFHHLPCCVCVSVCDGTAGEVPKAVRKRSRVFPVSYPAGCMAWSRVQKEVPKVVPALYFEHDKSIKVSPAKCASTFNICLFKLYDLYVCKV